jgi:tellurite resistance protein
MSDKLKFFPIQLFAVIMGISGLTIAFAKAYHFLNAPYFIYEGLLVIDTILFFLIFTFYIYKWLKYPDEVKKEFNHPIKSSFTATISISFLLVSIAYYDYAPTISIVFWYIGVALQLYLALYVIEFWITKEFKEVHMNPAWFIPIVGNVLVPVVGVDAAPIFVSIFFFAMGMFFWLVLFTMVMYRIIFHHPLAKKLLPTLFIFIAPPAVGFISYFRITFGSIDMFSMILYSLALITFILLVFAIEMFDFKEFFISWWAYTFPLAAMTIATILLYSAYHTKLIYWFAYLLLFITSIVILYVTQRTIKAMNEHKICIEEKE